MIWLAWRQFRASIITAAACLIVLAALCALTGPQLAHAFAASGIPSCTASTCQTLSTNFFNKLAKPDPILYFAGTAGLLIFPAVIGMFWGAPLIAREIEAGTLSLAWNQSVTRLRWLAVKAGLSTLVAMASAGLFSLALTWWASPMDKTFSLPEGKRLLLTRWSPLLFDTRDLMPAAYAAFAFLLGVTLGVLIQRTIPAMALTAGIFAVFQFVWPTWIRSRLLAPVHTAVALSAASISNVPVSGHTMTVQAVPTLGQQGAWVLSGQVINTAGQPFSAPATPACMTSDFNACLSSLGQFHLRDLITYQPASHFWAYQWTESAIYLGIALALGAVCAWRIQRYREA
jgi:hypothetical protein